MIAGNQTADLSVQNSPRLTERAKSAARILPIQPNGTQTPIFMVHDIQGDVDCYRTLAQCLGDGQPVYALLSLEGDLNCFNSVEELAAS
jgi:hypothetical protein